jgi:maltooligosyltrehalose trehalohydrolase
VDWDWARTCQVFFVDPGTKQLLVNHEVPRTILTPTASTPSLEQLPVGTTFLESNAVGFKVWAPRCRSVDLILYPKSKAASLAKHSHQAHWPVAGGLIVPLTPTTLARATDTTQTNRATSPEYFAAVVPDIGDFGFYLYRLNHRDARPDPRSRFQPFGVHGPSQLVDHSQFVWSDHDWSGVAARDLVIYELHVGCATASGTYHELASQLPRLRELGVTAIELLPLAETPGRWNWGYDGVHLYAPKAAYGTPTELKELINECHRQGLAVFLDVVYNHLGPEGNYLREFAPYFTSKTQTPWGEAFNYSGRRSQPVRAWILDNVRQWLQDYHFDGLRLDAIHYLFDGSSPNITAEVATVVRAWESEVRRPIHLIAETNVFDPQLVNSYSAQWADCFMHAVYSHAAPQVKLTNRDYRGGADVLTALERGFVYQGSQAREYARFEPTAANGKVHPHLVVSLQTHDSVGNHPHGNRVHQLTNIDLQKAAAGLLLLSPTIPQLFMGEEGAVDSPFCFFTDFGDPGLREAVDRGRQYEYPHHDWAGARLPSDPEAFVASRLRSFADWDHAVWDWYQLLLWVRRVGLRDGWLEPDKATWYHDPSRHYYRIDYGQMELDCRVESWLIPPGESRLLPEDTKLPGFESGIVHRSWSTDEPPTGSCCRITLRTAVANPG